MNKNYQFWFVTGSQHLYGEAVLKQVSDNAHVIIETLNAQGGTKNTVGGTSYEICHKDTVKTKEEITQLFKEANYDDRCAGLIVWMHTFSPSKMWINGLAINKKPILHLHTQFNRDIPWDTIDMDFMNTNQSAHGDREHGYIHTRMHLPRKVVVGHYQDPEVIKGIAKWQRVCVAVAESKNLKVARFGDNMRSVAVTDGDKVGAQMKFGWSVDYYGVGDLVAYVDQVEDQAVEDLYATLAQTAEIDPQVLAHPQAQEAVKYQLKLELAIKNFLDQKGYTAYTNTFEDLHGLKQLPGLASQRLMAQGYGFGPEGDWKVSAMLRLIKIMSETKEASLMEDYTYHLMPGEEAVLGAHMLEICPSIAVGKPSVQVHHLGIGGKEAPARLVFDAKPGKAVCISLVDVGGRFRLIVQDVEAIACDQAMPNLPVARVLWKPLPSFKEAAEAWIYAGGAHHTVFAYDVEANDLMDFARMLEIECVHIGAHTDLRQLEKELMFNDLVYKLT